MSSKINLSDIYTGEKGYGLFSNKKLEVLVLFAFACTGILMKIFFITKTDNTGDHGSASGTITGYGIIYNFNIMYIIY